MFWAYNRVYFLVLMKMLKLVVENLDVFNNKDVNETGVEHENNNMGYLSIIIY